MDGPLKSGCPWTYLLILVPAALAMAFMSTPIIRRKRMVHEPSSIVVNAMFTLVRPSQPIGRQCHWRVTSALVGLPQY